MRWAAEQLEGYQNISDPTRFLEKLKATLGCECTGHQHFPGEFA